MKGLYVYGSHPHRSLPEETMKNICQKYVAVPVFALDTWQPCQLEQMKSFRPEIHDWIMVFNTVQFSLLNNKAKFTENLKLEWIKYGSTLNTCILHDDDLTPELQLTALVWALVLIQLLQVLTICLSFSQAYVLGLLVTFAVMLLSGMGQPALLYLVPFTLITSVAVAGSRRELRHFWRGTPYEVRGQQNSFSRVQECSCSNKRNYSLLWHVLLHLSQREINSKEEI